MCDRIISEDPFMLVYCPDKYRTQIMCDEPVGDCLAALKSILDWFFTSKIIKKRPTSLCADDNILYFNEDSSDVIFSSNEIGILSIDLNNINLENSNFDEDDSATIILVRRLAWHVKFEKRKALKRELNA